MTPFNLDLEVSGVGPFAEPTSIGTIRPGVNLLRAPNGWGKTCLMRTLTLFSKRQLRAGDLTINDELTGSVAEAKLGPASIRAKIGRPPARDGHGDLPPIEGLPDLISSLEHGDHRKGADPRFRARLSALLAWAKVETDRDLLASLLGTAVPGAVITKALAAGSAQPDLVDAAKQIRSVIHAWRREEEQKAAGIENRIAQLEGRADQVLEDHEVTAEEIPLANELETARQHHRDAELAAAKVKQQRRSALDEQARRDELRRSHGERPQAKAALQAEVEGRAAAEAAQQAEREARAAVEEAQRALAVAQERLTAAERERVTQQALHLHTQERLSEVAAAADRWDETEQLLSQQIEGPSDGEVAEAESEERSALKQLRIAQAAQQHGAVQAQRSLEIDQLTAVHEVVGEAQREADLVWKRLADAVNERLGDVGIRVAHEDLEVEMVRDGEPVWLSLGSGRVSEGQWASACYELLLDRLDGQRIVVLEGSTAIDVARLERLGQLASERGAALLMETQETLGGEWELQHFGGEVVDAA